MSTESDSLTIRIGNIADCDSDRNDGTDKTSTINGKDSQIKPTRNNKKAKRPIADNRVKSTNC